jgi:hypothetical protein
MENPVRNAAVQARFPFFSFFLRALPFVDGLDFTGRGEGGATAALRFPDPAFGAFVEPRSARRFLSPFSMTVEHPSSRSHNRSFARTPLICPSCLSRIVARSP